MTPLTVADIRVGCHVYETSGLDDMADDVPDRRRHGTVIASGYSPENGIDECVVVWDVPPLPPRRGAYRGTLKTHTLPIDRLDPLTVTPATTHSNLDFYRRVLTYIANTPRLTPTTCAALTRTALDVLGAG